MFKFDENQKKEITASITKMVRHQVVSFSKFCGFNKRKPSEKRLKMLEKIILELIGQFYPIEVIGGFEFIEPEEGNLAAKFYIKFDVLEDYINNKSVYIQTIDETNSGILH